MLSNYNLTEIILYTHYVNIIMVIIISDCHSTWKLCIDWYGTKVEMYIFIARVFIWYWKLFNILYYAWKIINFRILTNSKMAIKLIFYENKTSNLCLWWQSSQQKHLENRDIHLHYWFMLVLAVFHHFSTVTYLLKHAQISLLVQNGWHCPYIKIIHKNISIVYFVGCKVHYYFQIAIGRKRARRLWGIYLAVLARVRNIKIILSTTSLNIYILMVYGVGNILWWYK